MPRDAAIIDALVSDLRHRINQARDVVKGGEYFQREVLRLTENIASFQRQLDNLNDLFVNGYDRIDQWKAQIAELNQEKTLHDNSTQIEKLLKLQKQLNAVEVSEDA
jgi:hypothetical protein